MPHEWGAAAGLPFWRRPIDGRAVGPQRADAVATSAGRLDPAGDDPRLTRRAPSPLDLRHLRSAPAREEPGPAGLARHFPRAMDAMGAGRSRNQPEWRPPCRGRWTGWEPDAAGTRAPFAGSACCAGGDPCAMHRDAQPGAAGCTEAIWADPPLIVRRGRIDRHGLVQPAVPEHPRHPEGRRLKSKVPASSQRRGASQLGGLAARRCTRWPSSARHRTPTVQLM